MQHRRLTRAFRSGAADFLLAWTTEDICERLTTVNRRFSRIADIGTPSPILAQVLAGDSEAMVARLSP
ncbi:MAG: SAM-dependent methyltransferase, partial [Bradyrhizobium sp.]